MEKVIEVEGGRPIKLWLDDIEDGALEQAKNAAMLPFTFRHVAVMPDAHRGYGIGIGSVVALDNVISPYMVGSDIACGMCALRTSLTDIDLETLKRLLGGSKEFHGGIRSAVPVGIGSATNKKCDESLMPQPRNLKDVPIVDAQWGKAWKSLGSLGAGNHFLEVQRGSDGHIWIMIHSGSRNLGYTVAKHYNNVAVELNKKWHSNVDPKWQLAFLPLDSQEGQTYLAEMNYCVEYALANRKLMMSRVVECFDEIGYGLKDDPDALGNEMINIAHNYAAMENHFGKNVMVHRKGATLAREGTIGIIPGSQGTKSYIVEGKGNRESFMSCSHGAGRKMSRTKAQKELNLEEEQKRLDDKGILHAIRGKKDLDEAAGAYKDISVVMASQEDLVDILVELSPLAVVKG